ncbi:MAG: hypothetical protein BGO30_07405 [Bacteroidetes bacterium 41-46]|nr:MAG: hypothetical protein BGO30_07405 [Bacteroidetes bacterium 41-46]
MNARRPLNSGFFNAISIPVNRCLNSAVNFSKLQVRETDGGTDGGTNQGKKQAITPHILPKIRPKMPLLCG